jgi:hypothetical protein
VFKGLFTTLLTLKLPLGVSYCFSIEGQGKKCQENATGIHLRMETGEGISTVRDIPHALDRIPNNT